MPVFQRNPLQKSRKPSYEIEQHPEVYGQRIQIQFGNEYVNGIK
jgi:hypothetical protein